MLTVLAILFVLSGAAGLFYEAVWSRYLSWAYEHLFPGLGGGISVGAAKRALAGLLILPQSISLLYFTNSLGAARSAYDSLRPTSGRREGDLIEGADPRAP